VPSSALLWGLQLAFLSPVGVATTLPVATVALVVIGGPAGVGSSMLFAHLRIPAERGIFLACAALTVLGSASSASPDSSGGRKRLFADLTQLATAMGQLPVRSTIPPEWIGRTSTPPPARTAGLVRASATAASTSRASRM